MVEFVDCSSMSIQYDATGKASLSFVVLKDSVSSLSNSYTHMTVGGVSFVGSIMSLSKTPILGSDWFEWRLQIQGVGN